MYAKIGTSQNQPGKFEDGARLVKEIVVPILKQQKGFKNMYVLVDRETGKRYSINLWESEADMKAFVESDTQVKMQAKMTEAGAPPMEWAMCEVVVEA